MSVKVLLVDDDRSYLESMLDIFQERGIDTTVASSGEEAIRKSMEVRFDLVILDVNMPGIDGVSVFKAIHEHDASLKVLFITAYADEKRIEHAIKHGAFGVMYKPVNIDRLLGVVTGNGSCPNHA